MQFFKFLKIVLAIYRQNVVSLILVLLNLRWLDGLVAQRLERWIRGRKVLASSQCTTK